MNPSNTKSPRKGNSNGRRVSKPNSVIGWALTPPSKAMYLTPRFRIPRPIIVVDPILLSGSTAVISSTGTNLAAGLQALDVNQISNFTSRFAGFREYLITHAVVIVQPVQSDAVANGMVAFYLDEASTATPSSTSLDNIDHLDLSVSTNNPTKAVFRWSPHDLDETTWQLMSSLPVALVYLKWYGDGANTALTVGNGTQLFLVDFYFKVAFRGLA
jgi:hypothetical protein